MKVNAVQNNLNFNGYIRIDASKTPEGKEKAEDIDTNDIIKIVASKPCPYRKAYIETPDGKYYTYYNIDTLLKLYTAASQNEDVLIDIATM